MKWIILLIILIPKTYATLLGGKPDDIVDIRKYLPNVVHDIRYFSKNNFIGDEIRGYISPKCLLQDHVAKDLASVQEDLKDLNLELIIYDCYRPQAAVNHFVEWAKDIKDIKMKHIFYPSVPKTELFSRGYIASKSGHSKGNTIDLGIIVKGSDIRAIKNLPLSTCKTPLTENAIRAGLIEMGTQYDCFDELSHTGNNSISDEAKYNRETLVKIMKKNNFKNYSKEWWHFSHRQNNYPTTYHEFFVE